MSDLPPIPDSELQDAICIKTDAVLFAQSGVYGNYDGGWFKLLSLSESQWQELKRRHREGGTRSDLSPR